MSTEHYEGPLYDSTSPLVVELAHVAWRLPMIRRFMALAWHETNQASTDALPIKPENTQADLCSPEQLLQCYYDEVARIERRRERLELDPSLGDDINDAIDWLIYGNTATLQEFNLAWSVYQNALKDWSGNNLAAIHTIWACNLFWEESRPNLNAISIRELAIQLWEDTEKLTRQKPFEDKLYSIKWPRLFDALGIPLAFPRGGWTRLI